MIMIYNHPSGRLTPSKEDVKITDRFLQLSGLIGIPLVDHVIAGGNNTEYFSFKEKGLIKIPKINYTDSYEYLDFGEDKKVADRGKDR